ncbi:hypothetical protein M885DRAFT_506799 [Pelagophyceae sp. CCMP2097]|nr:hypothetical protein M885DRAFT_506799 [Pelagophyceae sp. CCMP2097]
MLPRVEARRGGSGPRPGRLTVDASRRSAPESAPHQSAPHSPHRPESAPPPPGCAADDSESAALRVEVAQLRRALVERMRGGPGKVVCGSQFRGFAKDGPAEACGRCSALGDALRAARADALNARRECDKLRLERNAALERAAAADFKSQQARGREAASQADAQRLLHDVAAVEARAAQTAAHAAETAAQQLAAADKASQSRVDDLTRLHGEAVDELIARRDEALLELTNELDAALDRAEASCQRRDEEAATELARTEATEARLATVATDADAARAANAVAAAAASDAAAFDAAAALAAAEATHAAALDNARRAAGAAALDAAAARVALDDALSRLAAAEARPPPEALVRDVVQNHALGQIAVIAPCISLNWQDGGAQQKMLRPPMPTAKVERVISEDVLPRYTRVCFVDGGLSDEERKRALQDLAASMVRAVSAALGDYDAFSHFDLSEPAEPTLKPS